jgi:hypothetical protein
MTGENALLEPVKRYGEMLLDEASEPKAIPSFDFMFKLATELSKIIVLNHGGEVGEVDIIHYRLAEALRDVFYLGCLTEQKNINKAIFGDYGIIEDQVRKTLTQCFEMGVRYAPERERKSHQK